MPGFPDGEKPITSVYCPQDRPGSGETVIISVNILLEIVVDIAENCLYEQSP